MNDYKILKNITLVEQEPPQFMHKDVARDHWCPMTHVRFFTVTHQSGEVEQRENTCIADKCMAWLWDGPQERFGRCGLVKQ